MYRDIFRQSSNQSNQIINVSSSIHLLTINLAELGDSSCECHLEMQLLDWPIPQSASERRPPGSWIYSFDILIDSRTLRNNNECKLRVILCPRLCSPVPLSWAEAIYLPSQHGFLIRIAKTCRSFLHYTTHLWKNGSGRTLFPTVGTSPPGLRSDSEQEKNRSLLRTQMSSQRTARHTAGNMIMTDQRFSEWVA